MLKKFSLFLVLLAGVSWGSSPFFVNHLSSLGFDSLECTAIRLILSAPILHICLLAVEHKKPHFTLKSIVCFALCGICSVLAMCVCYYYAMQDAGAAVAAILLYSAPIFVMIMSAVFFKERLTAKKISSLIIVVVGCALTSGIVGGVRGSFGGIAVGIMSGFAYSLYSIISTVALREGNSPLTCTTYSFTFAALGALFIANPVNIVNKTLSLEKPLNIFLMMLLFCLFTSVIPYILYTFGLFGTKPEIAAIAASSEPVVATLIGVILLSQPLDAYQIVGIALVLIAIISLNLNIKVKKSDKSRLQ